MTRQLSFWLAWVLASATAGALIGSQAEPTSHLWELVAFGCAVGVAQWIVLRGYLPDAGWWILASALGWVLGSIVIFTTYDTITYISDLLRSVIRLPRGTLLPVGIFTVYSAVLGAAQWLVLRRHTQGAGCWVFASVVGGAVGGAAYAACSAILLRNGVSHWAVYTTVGHGANWAAYGAVTGVALVWLLL